MTEKKKMVTLGLPTGHGRAPVLIAPSRKKNNMNGSTSLGSLRGISSQRQPSHDKIMTKKNPSPSSDKNTSSDNGEASEPVVNTEKKTENQKADEEMDSRKLRRILSNRVSAQKYRLKKQEYTAEMERETNALEAQVASLTAQLTFYNNQNIILSMDNKVMEERISHLGRDAVIKDAQIDLLKEERERLVNKGLQKERMTAFGRGEQSNFNMMNPMNPALQTALCD